MKKDKRLEDLESWLNLIMPDVHFTVEPASSDASFRRYFRVVSDGSSRVVMDAPPELEDCAPFLHVSELLHDAGLNAPKIYQQDLANGYLLLSDLGKSSYLERLNDESVDWLYEDALSALLELQKGVNPQLASLPDYDEALLLREMGLFDEWFLENLMGVELSPEEQDLLSKVKKILVISALEQPRVCVHRDYHSRNLMVTEHNNPGVLDFQDAVIGPVTYDPVSLLKDCYISWPDEMVIGWLENYHRQLVSGGITDAGFDQFFYWFDLMGVQRHLKAIGIFARLKLRDRKDGYIADIPRTLDYVRSVCRRRAILSGFGDWIERVVMPTLGDKLK